MHQRGNPLVLSHNPPERWQKDIGETFYSMPMKSTDWIKQDYNAAFDFLLDNEADARSRPVLDTGQGVAVVLPTALPGLGVRFPGLFMAAPLIVFLCTLVAFPFVVLGSPLGWTVNALFVAALCLVLCLGLLLALKLMLGNRDLFPRASFATLGEEGIAMHYSRWLRPFAQPAAGIPWNRVVRMETRAAFYLPALFAGVCRATLLEVTARDGETIVIPLAPKGAKGLDEELRRRVGKRRKL